MKNKKVPMRSCIVTKERLPKMELIRVVKTPTGEVVVDETGKLNGRGAYLKRSVEVFEKASKNKALEKHLETVIPDSVFVKLKSMTEQK